MTREREKERVREIEKGIDYDYVWFLCFNGISTFVGYSMLKPSLQKKKTQQRYYLIHIGKIGRYIRNFPKSISPKENVKARVSIELTSFVTHVEYFSNYKPHTTQILIEYERKKRHEVTDRKRRREGNIIRETLIKSVKDKNRKK